MRAVAGQHWHLHSDQFTAVLREPETQQPYLVLRHVMNNLCHMNHNKISAGMATAPAHVVRSEPKGETTVLHTKEHHHFRTGKRLWVSNMPRVRDLLKPEGHLILDVTEDSVTIDFPSTERPTCVGCRCKLQYRKFTPTLPPGRPRIAETWPVGHNTAIRCTRPHGFLFHDRVRFLKVHCCKKFRRRLGHRVVEVIDEKTFVVKFDSVKFVIDDGRGVVCDVRNVIAFSAVQRLFALTEATDHALEVEGHFEEVESEDALDLSLVMDGEESGPASPKLGKREVPEKVTERTPSEHHEEQYTADEAFNVMHHQDEEITLLQRQLVRVQMAEWKAETQPGAGGAEVEDRPFKQNPSQCPCRLKSMKQKARPAPIGAITKVIPQGFLGQITEEPQDEDSE